MGSKYSGGTVKLEHGKRSKHVQEFLKANDMDRESWIEQVRQILPVSEERESLIEQIRTRTALVKAHDLLTSDLVELYKREGMAGLEVMRYLVDTKLMLADYRKRLEDENVNPLSDPVFQRAHNKMIEAAKALQEIEDKEKDRALKEKAINSQMGDWTVNLKEAEVLDDE